MNRVFIFKRSELWKDRPDEDAPWYLELLHQIFELKQVDIDDEYVRFEAT